MPSVTARPAACSTPPQVLHLPSDFDGARRAVIAAMCFPRSEVLSNAYIMRTEWADRSQGGGPFEMSAADVQAFLDLPSRAELSAASEEGVKRGTVAGDLLMLIYERWRLALPEPSMRAALLRYRSWAVGKTYGDGEALKYSDMQLRRYFAEAAPAAHLWAAFRLLKQREDGGAAYRAAFSPEGLPYLLGLAREIQEFASTFVPKRAKPPRPIIELEELLQIPDSIAPIAPEMRPL